MMPFTPHRDNHRADAFATRCRRRGFTLTELLVVIGIVVLVLSIATPMVTRAWRTGDKTRMAADLQAIAGALEAYRQDHGSYPQVAPAPGNISQDFNGARMLCRALIAPGPEVQGDVRHIPDGKGADITPADPTKPGPGFRTRGRSGRVYGPYLKPETFKIGDPTPGTPVEGVPGYWALLDRYNRPILYYSTAGKPNIRLKTSYAWDRDAAARPLYNALDNWDVAGKRGAMPKEMLAYMLGDHNGNGQIDPASGSDPEEVPAHEGPYLLWSAGPDEVFGIPMTSNPPKTVDEIRRGVEKSDDVTNFRH